MEMKLQAELRTTTGSKESKRTRSQGSIPAIVYGGGENTTHIVLSTKEFDKIWKQAGENTVITLTGAGKDKSVLVQEVSVDPLYGTPMHVDLYAVKADESVEVAVPLTFEGVAPAEKELGGTLLKVMHELEIEALPQNLPGSITVDISSLATFDDIIHVSDLSIPKGVTSRIPDEDVVALVQPAKEEEEEPVVEEQDVADIEVEKKGKEEEQDTE